MQDCSPGALLAGYKTAELTYTFLKVSSSEHRIWHALAVGAQDDFPLLFLDVSMDAALSTPRYDQPGEVLNSHTDAVGCSDNDNVCGIEDDTSGDRLEGSRSSIFRSYTTSSSHLTGV